jgi:nucleotide-binding universal stress UspA family protein
VDAVDVRLVVSEGHAVTELLKRSEHADLLVVGSRGRGAMRSALLGSVALHCTTHARCPVVVVHPMSSVAPSARVVVGVDGSAESRAALVAALQEARRIGAEVEVVAAYFPADYWTDATLVLVQTVEAIRADLQRRTDEFVADVMREEVAAGGAPRVRTAVLEGPAAEVLLQRAQNADARRRQPRAGRDPWCSARLGRPPLRHARPWSRDTRASAGQHGPFHQGQWTGWSSVGMLRPSARGDLPRARGRASGTTAARRGQGRRIRPSPA